MVLILDLSWCFGRPSSWLNHAYRQDLGPGPLWRRQLPSGKSSILMEKTPFSSMIFLAINLHLFWDFQLPCLMTPELQFHGISRIVDGFPWILGWILSSTGCYVPSGIDLQGFSMSSLHFLLEMSNTKETCQVFLSPTWKNTHKHPTAKNLLSLWSLF